jgi:hypothetical protein
MATGYTTGIKDGISFEEYALKCARAFGALAEMRDAPWDAEIPDKFEPSSYHKESLERAEKALLDFKPEEIDAEFRAQREYDKAVENRLKRLQETTDLERKYRAMLEKVRAYVPPSEDHVGYKEFMESQITQSIDFDCGTSYFTHPVKLSGEEWLEEELKRLQRDAENAREHYRKEIELCEGRTKWVRLLKKSLNL